MADGRHLAGRARDECESYRDSYHIRVPTKVSFVTAILFSFRARSSADADLRIDACPRLNSQTLAERLALYLQAYTLYSSVRPFGLSVVLAGWDSPVSTAGSDTIVERKAEGKPALYMIEPSGTYCVRPSECSVIHNFPP